MGEVMSFYAAVSEAHYFVELRQLRPLSPLSPLGRHALSPLRPLAVSPPLPLSLHQRGINYIQYRHERNQHDAMTDHFAE